VPGEGVGLNVSRVEALLSDAVAEKYNAVTVLNEELAGDGAGSQQFEGDEGKQ